jgi:Mg2+/Co2+ transporter CorB
MDGYVFIYFISIAILLACSAFFSGSETGLTALSKAKIQGLSMRGVKHAQLVMRLRKNKNRLISAIRLGNNAVNILASALATSLAIHYFEEDGVIVATVVMTLLVLIFAEVLPKTYAVHNAERVSIKVAPVLNICVMLFAPITHLVQMGVDVILRLFGGIDNQDSEHDISPAEELRGAIELQHKEGRVVKRERDMLGSILDLAETEVGEVMIHRKHMVSVNINQSVEAFVGEIMQQNHTRVPVWEKTPENIVGVIHVKTLYQALQKHQGNKEDLDVKSLVLSPWFVPETTPLDKQLSEFRRRRYHLALVVDEYGDLIGLVTLEDVLEEIVGHIQDEHDGGFDGVKLLNDGSFLVDGTVTLRDLKRLFEWDFEDEEASTIAGYVINALETIPEKGQKFAVDGFRFEIVEKEDNQLSKLKISPRKHVSDE